MHILLGSSENSRDPRLRKPSAPEAGRLLKDCREHCFVNEKVFKNISKNNNTLRILFSWDWHDKSTFCNGFNSLRRTTTFKLSFFQNSHSFGIFLCKVCQPYCFHNAYSFGIFSAKSASSTIFRIPILLVTEIFLCEAHRFQKTLQILDARKNTPLGSLSTEWSQNVEVINGAAPVEIED